LLSLSTKRIKRIFKNKEMKITAIITLALCLMFNGRLSAQERFRVNYSGDNESLLQDQASIIFDHSSKVLAAYPPSPNPGIERKMALYALDALFHDTRLDKGPAFMSYMKQVISNIATELPKNKPTGREMRVFQFYNFGFIIQTASVTVGIDLIRGGRESAPYISDSLMRSIVDQCDILFVTHRHGDHASLTVTKMFCEQGKNVIVPEEFWKELSPQLRVLRGAEMIRENIPLPGKNTSLTVWAYPGYQEDLANNVYIITLPEGQTIMQTGDQTLYEDLADKVNSNKIKVDALLVGCAAPMHIIVDRTNPSYVFTGHENEMEHSIDHREAYWLTFRRMHQVKVPFIVLSWGESYLISN